MNCMFMILLNVTIALWPRPISLNARTVLAYELHYYDGRCFCEVWEQYFHLHSMLSHCRTM